MEKTQRATRCICLFSQNSVWTGLEITRIGAGLAVDETSVCRADEPLSLDLIRSFFCSLGCFDEEFLHGGCELLEKGHITGNVCDLVCGLGLKVGNEIALFDQVRLALGVLTGLHTIVGTLEEAELTIDCKCLGDGRVGTFCWHDAVTGRLSGISVVFREPG